MPESLTLSSLTLSFLLSLSLLFHQQVLPLQLEGSNKTVEDQMKCEFNGKGNWGWSEKMKTCVSALRLLIPFPSSYLFIYLFIYFSFFLDLLGRLLTKRHVHVFFLKFLFLLFCLFVFVFVFVPASSPYLLNTWRLRQNKNLWPSPFLSFHAVSFYHIGQGFARNWKWKMRLKRMSGVQKRQLRFLSIVIIVAILR